MFAAPSWPLIAPPVSSSGPSEMRPPSRSRVETGVRFRLTSQGKEAGRLRTQKNVRGAKLHPPRQIVPLRTAKARNCFISQRSAGGLLTDSPDRPRLFVLPPRYRVAIVEIRGLNPQIPTKSCVCPRFRANRTDPDLLELDLGAGLLELGLDLVGFFLV